MSLLGTTPLEPTPFSLSSYAEQVVAEVEAAQAAEAERLAATQAEEPYTGPEPGSQAYGTEAAPERESNFISDSDLLLWLAQKQDGMYAELRDLMDMSRERSKFIEDLSHLKAMVDGGASGEVIQAEMDAMLQAYAGTPYEAELRELFDDASVNGVAIQCAELADQATGMERGDELRKRLSQTLEGKIDALGRDDQLTLIEIQSLTSDIRETAQLVSNLMASSSQAANTIVGNVRG